MSSTTRAHIVASKAGPGSMTVIRLSIENVSLTWQAPPRAEDKTYGDFGAVVILTRSSDAFAQDQP